MSRKWKRMVDKNTSNINKQRKKQGKPTIRTGESPYEEFKGRSIWLPLFLIIVALLFFFSYGRTEERDGLFWITIVMYFLLAFYYFMRRPFIRVAGNYVSTRKLGREVFLKPSEIEGIIVDSSTVMISVKGKKNKWTFSRSLQRFPTREIGKALTDFAAKHGLAVLNKMEGDKS